MWEHEPDQKLKRNQYYKEEEKTLFHENIRALGWLCKVYYLIEFFMEMKIKCNANLFRSGL